jgi:hypothetical protein
VSPNPPFSSFNEVYEKRHELEAPISFRRAANNELFLDGLKREYAPSDPPDKFLKQKINFINLVLDAF